MVRWFAWSLPIVPRRGHASLCGYPVFKSAKETVRHPRFSLVVAPSRTQWVAPKPTSRRGVNLAGEKNAPPSPHPRRNHQKPGPQRVVGNQARNGPCHDLGNGGPIFSPSSTSTLLDEHATDVGRANGEVCTKHHQVRVTTGQNLAAAISDSRGARRHDGCHGDGVLQ